MRLSICGDSHVVALGQGLLELGDAAKDIFPGPISCLKLFSCPKTLKPFFDRTGDHITFRGASVRESFAELTGAAALAASPDSVYAFSLAFTTKFLIREDCWLSATPYGHAQVAGKTVLSNNVMASILREHYKHQLRFLADCKRLNLKFLIIGSPPLRSDNPHLKHEEHRITRQHVDAMAREFMKGELERLAVPFVLAPDGVSSEGGYLRAEYCAVGPRDYYHANGLYGALMVRRVAARAAELFA